VPKCPECGIDLEGRDVRGHANDHWPENIRDEDLGKEARERRKLLLGGGEE